MALDPLNVHIGPARIFLNVTNPATGTPPTWMPHTAGVPTPGDEVGYTQGDTTFSKTKETADVIAEQSMAPVATYLTAETVEVTFNALERTYNTLRAAFDNIGTVNDGTRMGFYGGGLQYALRTQSVMFSSLRPNQAGKYEIGVIYRAVNVGGYVVAYRKAESLYAVTLRGVADGSRSIGDQVFQYSVEK